MWTAITVNRRMLPTSELNRRPLQTESGANIDRNTHKGAKALAASLDCGERDNEQE
jgi:hypothetical protein